MGDALGFPQRPRNHAALDSSRQRSRDPGQGLRSGVRTPQQPLAGSCTWLNQIPEPLVHGLLSEQARESPASVAAEYQRVAASTVPPFEPCTRRVHVSAIPGQHAHLNHACRPPGVDGSLATLLRRLALASPQRSQPQG